MLIPLPFHGQSSTECVDAVFAEPSVIAATGKYPLGQNSSIYDPAAFKESKAPQGLQEIWAAYREPKYARSRIVCTNVAESGVTVPNVGVVTSSGVQYRHQNRFNSECASDIVQGTIAPAIWAAQAA